MPDRTQPKSDFSFCFRWLALLMPFLCSCATAHSTSPKVAKRGEMSRKVVLISLDGLRPEFYLSKSYSAPTLHELATSGTSAQAMASIFPSLTYPAHTSMVTGLFSSEHGITGNLVFSPKTGPTSNWCWNADFIKAPTIWDVARSSGKTVAIVRWPVSTGARVNWLVPEVFGPNGIHPDDDMKLVEKGTDPELWKEIRRNSKIEHFETLADVDQMTTEAAVHILQKFKPDLTLIHLINVDYMQHHSGRDSLQTRAALAEADAHLKEILGAIDLKTTAVVVVGDHGFMDYDKSININVLFSEQGWIQQSGGKVTAWSVIAQPDGGQAAIYTRDTGIATRVVSLLKEKAHGRFRVLERKQLDELKAYPEAICAIEAEAGYVIGNALSGELVSSLKETKAHHGYLPDRAQMQTGFVAAGAGVSRGRKLDRVNILDIAPTIADILGVDFRDLPNLPLSSEGFL